ncbi:MAG: ADP-ribosylglycohydrolase family protein, partial [Gemmatimonadales bacterium]|nr:ADP-ribosylglycohydrolase family protein [Gemmatimonadales bacterium]
GPLPVEPPAGRRRAPVALGDALVEELISGGVDLRRLAQRWITWHDVDGLDAEPALTEALVHLGSFDAPRPSGGAPCVAAIAAALPAAMTASAPQAMIGGAFHVSRLLDPDESTALAAVVTVVSASRLLAGHRDFIPDALAVLRANDAPPDVVEAIARIPRDPRNPPPRPDHAASPIASASWILWIVHHRPRGVRALEEMALAGGVPVSIGSVLGALIGARDGTREWPPAWIDSAGQDAVLRRSLAARLTAPAP